MARSRPTHDRIDKTPNFDFLFGLSGCGQFVVPYFQVTMSLKEAAQQLRLVNEMPGSASMKLSIEELFQRDINWTRVLRKIVPYLRNATAPQFFNSLTIALLPVKDNALTTYDASEVWAPPELAHTDGFTATRSFGPISCGYWGEWISHTHASAHTGQLAWNKDQVCGVAIDGQHRLAAIKTLIDEGGAQADSTVPVLLLVLHPALGYREPTVNASLIDTLRKLFIDLNKHARTVSRARQILLDDRDPASLCVRAVVGNELCEGHHELTADPPSLPLTLVDWHSEQAKFDDGPYLTTILGLDWIVATLLAVKPFENPLGFDESEKLIDRLERKLAIDLSEARQRLADCRRYERPFGFREEGPDELARIEDGFRRQWAKALMTLLTEFKPYRDLISSRDTAESLTPDFGNWYACKANAEGAGPGSPAVQMLGKLESQLTGRETDPISIGDFAEAVSKANSVKARYPLAFTVVFQRALVYAYDWLLKVPATMTAQEPAELFDEGDDESSADGYVDQTDGTPNTLRASQLIEALNKIVRGYPAFLTLEFDYRIPGRSERFDHFWLCALLNIDGTIDFSVKAAKRSSDLLLLAALFHIFIDTEGLGADDFDKLMKRAKEATSGLDKKLANCLNRMIGSEDNGSIAVRILQSRDQKTEDESLRYKEISQRAHWIWKALTD
jgi:DGQHR domain-containing protein